MSETPGSEAVRALRAMILAGERYRQALADQYGLGITENPGHQLSGRQR